MTKQQIFIYETAPAHLESLTEETKGKWGVMGPQHMVEHLSSTFYISMGKKELPIVTPPEKIPRRREWLLSDLPFMKNVLIKGVQKAEPSPLRFADIDEAKEVLAKTTEKFKQHFHNNPGLVTNHPVIGPLNQSDWEQFHYKHLVHHLTQFGLIEEQPTV